MKFTKLQALEHIKSLLGQTQVVSDRTINEQLDTLMPLLVTDETELTEFTEKVSKMFESINLNVKHEKSLFLKEQKPPENQPPVIQPVTPNAFSMDDFVSALETRLNPLTDEIKRLKNEASFKELIGQAKARFEALNPRDEKRKAVDKAYKTVSNSVNENDTVDSLFDRIKGEYDDIVAANGEDNGYKPLESDKSAEGADMQARMDKYKETNQATATQASSMKDFLQI